VGVKSQCVANIDSVIEHAVDVFGDKEEALRWLGTPVRALSGATPISRLSTLDGQREVRVLLARLEHGVLRSLWPKSIHIASYQCAMPHSCPVPLPSLP